MAKCFNVYVVVSYSEKLRYYTHTQLGGDWNSVWRLKTNRPEINFTDWWTWLQCAK